MPERHVSPESAPASEPLEPDPSEPQDSGCGNRAPTEDELKFLQALLSHDFEGVEALRSQLDLAQVTSSCSCGCGSIGFSFGGVDVERSKLSGRLPVEAEIVSSDGAVLGGVIVFLQDGLLGDVDVHPYGDGPLSLPTLDHVRWTH